MKLRQNLYNPSLSYPFLAIDARKAYQQAGQAAAICISNKQKKLPVVYFKILIGPQAHALPESAGGQLREINPNSVLIEGGRLVDNMLLLPEDMVRYFSPLQLEHYRCALEADITNLLIGLMAEAKYGALLAKTPFVRTAASLETLMEQCDLSQRELIGEYLYLYRYVPNPSVKRLLNSAFNFVSKPSCWRAISKLARFIQSKVMDAITCEEAAAIVGPYAHEMAGHYHWPQSEKQALSEMAGLYG